ncbi:UNVERIFIED_CONTAM: putative cytochrome c biosynthesis protein [Sesamum latifolium]|uniref:Cytochrome c biosynthesis protein n=1 Tax=Sesamum latifolium TaxID=2727402 RepID=A0AAW2S2T8_9LAMI
MSFAPMGARRSRGSREGKRTHPLLHLARDDKERASFIDEQRIDGALGIALFFSPFLSATLFVRNFFVRTEPLAESILFHKILYQLYILLANAGDVSAMGALAYVDQK